MSPVTGQSIMNFVLATYGVLPLTNDARETYRRTY